MIKVGRMNRLQVVKQKDFGVFLDGGRMGTILLPRRYVPENTAIGDELNVFIYMDSEDCTIATTLTPKVMVGECAYLTVKEVNEVGAFLDWGLPKDLLVPYSEQHRPMEAGRSYVVTVFLDQYTYRITASSRLSQHLEERADNFKVHQGVDLLICGKSDMGYKAVINHTHMGLIFRDDAFRPLNYGEHTQGFIKAIRPDKKIDLSLQMHSSQGRDDLEQRILQYLDSHNGVCTLTDKSEPDDIHREFNVSKGKYKSALSKLYKQRKIVIETHQITKV